jgi:anti-sigma-K factor RskA
MTEHEVHTLTGAYAADALPADERHAFDEHLEQCAACRQEVAELTATTSRLGAAVATPAPAGMRSRVLAEVANTRQASPVVRGLHKRPAAQPWFRQPVGIAASFLLVLSLSLAAVAAVENRRADRAERTAERIAAIVTDPDRASASREINSGGSGLVITADHGAVFRADRLRSLPANRTYQLWIMDAKGGARSVGLLGRGGPGSVERFVDDINDTDQIGLTVEPKGGSKGPTTTPLLVLPVPA